MAIKIKTQKDCLSTRVSLECTDLNELDALMRATKATGSIIATYNQGGRMGVNIEQNKHIPEKMSENIRELLGVGTRELECK